MDNKVDFETVVHDGELKVHIQETFPLENISEAHDKLETGRTRGEIVVELAAP